MLQGVIQHELHIHNININKIFDNVDEYENLNAIISLSGQNLTQC